MKNKKLIAIILALAMIFAFSTSAFAVNGSPAVSIEMEGFLVYDDGLGNPITVTAADIAELAGEAEHLYEVDPRATDALTCYTAADALIAAYMMYYGYESLDDIIGIIDTVWYNTSPYGEPEHYGMYFSMFDGLLSDDGQYYYVGPGAPVEGQPTYRYYWEGLSWELSINGSIATEYLSEYALSDVNSIEFNYTTVSSDYFDTTNYFYADPAPVNP